MAWTARILGAASLAALVTTPALAENAKVVFGSNWVAQAEHGGFYQSVADGTYAACGLDVTIQPGGPQVNNRALMIAGKVDYHMGGNLLETFSAVAEGIPIVAVGASFQKEPQVIVTHPGRVASFDEIKTLPRVFIGDAGFASFYQWMINAYGFTAEQRVPYTFNAAPFIADKDSAMQGYLSSEPYYVAKEGGFEPDVWLIADAGYSTYSTIIETMGPTVAEKPEQVKCFVEGSIKGWYNYLYGDNTAANDLIKKDNPDMSDEAIAYAIAKMKEAGIVDSGDALEKGIGVMTEEKVKDFYDKMVAAGVVAADLDWASAIDFTFAGNGVGMDLKK
ncbi:MAG: ABC transporter substrate-binding protein [Paracoccaceae bacterium]|nr:MAG: ABC transporter substrate-binding protein [Paracoccaceae bacterium]